MFEVWRRDPALSSLAPMERRGTPLFAGERLRELRSPGLERPRRLHLLHGRLFRWLSQHQAGPFDLPTSQEWAILFGGVLLAPLILPLLIIALPFTSVLRDLSWPRRIALVLGSPVLLPAAYLLVLVHDVARPMYLRWRTRRRLLKQADLAVKELVREGLGKA